MSCAFWKLRILKNQLYSHCTYQIKYWAVVWTSNFSTVRFLDAVCGKMRRKLFFENMYWGPGGELPFEHELFSKSSFLGIVFGKLRSVHFCENMHRGLVHAQSQDRESRAPTPLPTQRLWATSSPLPAHVRKSLNSPSEITMKVDS